MLEQRPDTMLRVLIIIKYYRYCSSNVIYPNVSFLTDIFRSVQIIFPALHLRIAFNSF